MTDDVRPVWDFPIDQDTLRWFKNSIVRKVTPGISKSSGETTFRRLRFYNQFDDMAELDTIDQRVIRIFDFIEFSPNGHCGLFRPTKLGMKANARIEAIDEFDKTHERDWKEYQRLKAKFAGRNPSDGQKHID